MRAGGGGAQRGANPPLALELWLELWHNKAHPEGQDPTWRFVTWLLKPDVYHSRAVGGSFRLPLMPAAAESEEYQKFLKENPQRRPFADQPPGAFVTPTTVLGDELSTGTGTAVRRAVTGEQSPRDSLASAAREFDALVR